MYISIPQLCMFSNALRCIILRTGTAYLLKSLDEGSIGGTVCVGDSGDSTWQA